MHGLAKCTEGEIFKQGTFLLHDPVCVGARQTPMHKRGEGRGTVREGGLVSVPFQAINALASEQASFAELAFRELV